MNDPSTSISPRLFKAVRRGDLQTVETILSAPIIHDDGSTSAVNPDVPEFGTRGTALLTAVCTGQVDMVDLLLKFKANPNIVDETGLMPLHYAALHGRPRIARSLIRSGADINALSGYNSYAPIHYALNITTEDDSVFAVLVEAGAKLDGGKHSLLHMAARCTNIQTAQILVKEKGFDPALRDAEGKTPADVAKDSHIRDLFLKWEKEKQENREAAFKKRLALLDHMASGKRRMT